MALPAPDVSLVTRKREKPKKSDIELFFSCFLKDFKKFTSSKTPQNIYFFYKTQYPRAFRLIGWIKEHSDNCATLQIQKCTHFSEHNYRPKNNLIEVCNFPTHLVEKFQNGMTCSLYVSLRPFGHEFRFCVHSSQHNKIRQARITDYEQFFMKGFENE